MGCGGFSRCDTCVPYGLQPNRALQPFFMPRTKGLAFIWLVELNSASLPEKSIIGCGKKARSFCRTASPHGYFALVRTKAMEPMAASSIANGTKAASIRTCSVMALQVDNQLDRGGLCAVKPFLYSRTIVSSSFENKLQDRRYDRWLTGRSLPYERPWVRRQPCNSSCRNPCIMFLGKARRPARSRTRARLCHRADFAVGTRLRTSAYALG